MFYISSYTKLKNLIPTRIYIRSAIMIDGALEDFICFSYKVLYMTQNPIPKGLVYESALKRFIRVREKAFIGYRPPGLDALMLY